MATGNVPQNYTKSEYERADNDFYVEPSWCVEALADEIPFSGTVWDPACGTGTIPEVFRQRGARTWASDRVDRGYRGADQNGVFDFLVGHPDDDWVQHGFLNIVTNPPFDQSKEFAYRALTLPAVRRVAIIQQVRFLCGQRRFELFAAHAPSDVLILSRRPSMPPGHRLPEMLADGTAFKGGAIDYAWIVWDRQNSSGETRLRWLNPQR